MKELTQPLQLRKPRHTKRPQLHPGEAGTETKRIVPSVSYKRNGPIYNDAQINYEKYLDSRLHYQTNDFHIYCLKIE